MSINNDKKLTKRGRMLSSEDKLISESENSLALLWRTILRDLNITNEKWNLLMGMYLTDPINGFDNKLGSDIGHHRGNLDKALCSTKVQMLNFNRALKFLQVERAKYTFTLYPKDPQYPIKDYSINTIIRNGVASDISEMLNEDIKYTEDKAKRRRFVDAYRPKRDIDAVIRKYSGDFSTAQWLEDPSKMINLATGMLSKLWRIILSDRKIDLDTWSVLIQRYLKIKYPECDVLTGNETKQELKARSKKKSNIKGNIADELQRPFFTIDVFMKGMVFLEIDKLDITLQLKRKNIAKLSYHSIYNWDPTISIEKSLKKKGA